MRKNPSGSATVTAPYYHRSPDDHSFFVPNTINGSRRSRSPPQSRRDTYQDRPPRAHSQVPLRVRDHQDKRRTVSPEQDKMAYRSDYGHGHGIGPAYDQSSTAGYRRQPFSYVVPPRGGYHPGQYETGAPNSYPSEPFPYPNTASRAAPIPHPITQTNQYQHPHLQSQVHSQIPYYQNAPAPEQLGYMTQPQSTQVISQQPPPPPTIQSMAMVQQPYEPFGPPRSTSLVPSNQFNPQWQQDNEVAKLKAEMEKQNREIALEKAEREAKKREEEERKKKAEEEAKHLRDIEEARRKEREEIERQRKAEEESRLATAKAIQEATIKAQKDLEESIRKRQEEDRLAREREEESRLATAKAIQEATIKAQRDLEESIKKREEEDRLAKEKEKEQREKIRKEFEEKAKREAEAKEAAAQRRAKEKQELEQRIKLERENAAREAEEKQRAEIAAKKAEAEREAARQAAIDKRIEEEKKAAAAKALEQQKAKQEREAKLAAEKAAEEKRLKDVQAEFDRLRKTAADERAKLIEENAKAKKEGEENAKKALKASEEAIAKLMAPDKKSVIKFKDALGRKFSFPFHLCSTWQGMDELIQQAFQQVPMFRSAVQSHFYDLIGPNGDIIIPAAWDINIEPDTSITMQMWAMDDKINSPMQGTPGAQAPPPPPPPPPPPQRPAAPPAKPRRRAAEPKRPVGVLSWVVGRPTRPTRGSR